MFGKIRKGDMSILVAILGLLILAIVLFTTFVVTNNFTEAMLGIKERLGPFSKILELGMDAYIKLHG